VATLAMAAETWQKRVTAESKVNLDLKLNEDLKFMRKQRNFWVWLLVFILWTYVSNLSRASNPRLHNIFEV
jgi:hypothetical protein